MINVWRGNGKTFEVACISLENKTRLFNLLYLWKHVNVLQFWPWRVQTNERTNAVRYVLSSIRYRDILFFHCHWINHWSFDGDLHSNLFASYWSLAETCRDEEEKKSRWMNVFSSSSLLSSSSHRVHSSSFFWKQNLFGWIEFSLEVPFSNVMPTSAVIRTQQQQQQQQQPANSNSANSSMNHHSEKHTISIFRLLLRAFDYIYLINTKIFLYFLLMLRRLLRFIIGLWTFLFLSLRGSKKKVGLTSISWPSIFDSLAFLFSSSSSWSSFNRWNITIVLFNLCPCIDFVSGTTLHENRFDLVFSV